MAKKIIKKKASKKAVEAVPMCEHCHGTGRHLPDQTCPTCQGTGKPN